MRRVTLLFLALVFIGCSGKVQTNKIPDDTKFTLPLNYQSANDRNQVLEDQKAQYDEFATDFFNVKEQRQSEQNIYFIGIKRGHFINE